jgi:hypothetical protein
MSTPFLKFSDFIDTTADEQRWQIFQTTIPIPNREVYLSGAGSTANPPQLLSTGTGVFSFLNIGNLTGSNIYISFYDLASTANLISGSSIPFQTYLVTSSANSSPALPANGFQFTNGLVMVLSNAIATAGGSGVGGFPVYDSTKQLAAGGALVNIGWD